MNVIDIGELGAYLDPVNVDTPRGALVITLVNGLFEEKWLNPPTDPDAIPSSVKVLALEVAARALASTPGRGQVESVTRGFDDSTRTERYAVQARERNGVYLTAEELADLNGNAAKRTRRPRSIGLLVPGFTDV